jgi:alkylation response protein AidB-like acyl-CoA dehydrogenase
MTTTVEDSELFRSAVRAALTRLSSAAAVRRALASPLGFDDQVWQRLSRDMGLPGLTLPEKLGGGGFTEAELAIAFEEAGASLLCAPLFATAALAVPLLRALDEPALASVGSASADRDEAAIARFGPAISSGELTATVALAEDDGRWATDTVRCAATPVRSEWVLEGVKNYVVDGASAGLILVVARTGAGELGVFAVHEGAAGLERERLVTLDQTRTQARLVLRTTPAERVGTGDAAAAIARATAVSRALLAAEQVGGAQHCLDLTVEYAKTRIQFGRPIGSFQAVKQRLAEMLVRVESARSAALAAVTAAAAGDPGAATGDLELAHVAAVAALTCGEAYTWVTEQTIQLHGGIGFTWEHDAHLYFKRARASALLLGSASELTDLLGRQLEAIVEVGQSTASRDWQLPEIGSAEDLTASDRSDVQR